jgi:hypothetical protein
VGGDIRMVVRFEDGTIHPQVRWTNNYPLWIRTPAFLTGDERVMRAYLSCGEENARKDPLVAPVGYGLYLVDHLTRQIVNASEWSSCRDATFARLHFMVLTALIADEAFPGCQHNFRRLLEGGFLSLERRRYRGSVEAQMAEPWENTGTITVPFDRWDEDLYLPREGGSYRERTHQHRVCLDFSRHWTLSSFKTDEPGAKEAALAKLDEIGFPLTEADREGWARYGAEE